MRIELETKFTSKRIILTSKDKNTIDCFLILNNNEIKGIIIILNFIVYLIMSGL